MIQDAMNWLSNFTIDQWFLTFCGLILFDLPRYLLANTILIFWDFMTSWKKKSQTPAYLPSVTVLIPSLNESATITQCLQSLYGTYPYLQLIVIDDGSTDSTFDLATQFAQKHDGILVLRRPRGGGKSTAQNFAYPYITGEIIVVVDSDSTFGDHAIYHLVQPFRDPLVGGVSGSILVRNPEESLCSAFQAYEYLISILVSRILSEKLGTLSIISGAFGAFRKTIFQRGYGMDVGPSEDSDITLRLRKLGYKIIFEPKAECFTDVPVSWKGLWKQRLRWDMGIVRIHLRKHIDNAHLFSNNFRLTNFMYWYDTIFFSVWCTLSFWVVLSWMIWSQPWSTIQNLAVCVVLAYMFFGFFQSLNVLYHSQNWKRDLPPCLVFPIYMLYGSFFMRAVRTIAIIDEWLNRSSYSDSYVPKWVQIHAFAWKSKF